MLTFDLPTLWAFIIAFAIFAYVVMDGFDLGIGILFSRIPAGHERDTAMNTIAPVWDGNETWLVLGGGGLLAAFPLGALLQGIAVENRAYAGGWFDWLTPFSVLVGVSLVCGYALLGSTWLIMKSEGPLQERCYRLALRLGIATIIAMAAVSAYTPFLKEAYWLRWFAWPQVLFTAQVPLLVAIASVVF